MSQPNYPHHDGLLDEALDCLNRYTPFAAQRQVTFTREGTGWPPTSPRTDGAPIPDSADPLTKKLAHLPGQKVVIRPFFFPMAKSPWQDKAANEFTTVDFDYAAILGYGLNPDGQAFLKGLYFLPTDALLDGQTPRRRRVWRIRPATYYVHQLSLDPRKKFARFLYLVERITEAMEYQYDKCGFFFSVSPDDPLGPLSSRGEGFSYIFLTFWKKTWKAVAPPIKMRYTGDTIGGGKSPLPAVEI